MDHDSNEIRLWIASFLVHLTKYLCIKPSSPLKQRSEMNIAQHFFLTYGCEELKYQRNVKNENILTAFFFFIKVKITVGFEHGIAKLLYACNQSKGIQKSLENPCKHSLS